MWSHYAQSQMVTDGSRAVGALFRVYGMEVQIDPGI